MFLHVTLKKIIKYRAIFHRRATFRETSAGKAQFLSEQVTNICDVFNHAQHTGTAQVVWLYEVEDAVTDSLGQML